MFQQGYIKLFRKILGWEWYKDANTARLFFHLLLTVNIKDDRWMGHDILKGSRVVSIAKLSEELGLTNRQIRTSLAHLLATNEVTKSQCGKSTAISIVRWDEYQSERQEKRSKNDKKCVNEVTTKRQQNKNIKNIKNKEIEKEPAGGVASQPFFELSPSKMKTDDKSQSGAERLQKMRES